MTIIVDDKGLVSIAGLNYSQFYMLCAAMAGSKIELAGNIRWNREKRMVNIVLLSWDQVMMISAIMVDSLKLINDIVEATDCALEMAVRKK
jgi:hypothetical protein